MARAPDCRVALFAKAPVPGQVKTRLIPALGAEGATRFHEACVRQAIVTALEADIGPVEICCAPNASQPYFRALADEFPISLTEQGSGDLGDRMHRALERGLAQHDAMLLIGADCLVLAPRDLRDAAHALRDHDTVFAPAEDGGYVLIGARRVEPALFQNVAWSTERVMQQTRDNLARLHWSHRELRTLWDVDRPEDHERARREGLCAH